MKPSNLYENVPPRGPEELFEELLQGRSFRVERIVSQGHASPHNEWYDQDQPEWVLLLVGEAVLEVEGREAIALGPGDYLCLPAHCRHRVASTASDRPTVWLAIHYEETPEL